MILIEHLEDKHKKHRDAERQLTNVRNLWFL